METATLGSSRPRRRLWIALWLATLAAFNAALEWRLRDTAWYANFVAAAAISWLLTQAFARKHVRIQVFLQWRRRVVNALALTMMTAWMLANVAAIGRWPDAKEVFDVSQQGGWLLAGFTLGVVLRRGSALAASPGYSESTSLRPRAMLHFWLALTTCFAPSFGTIAAVGFIAATLSGVSAYWLRREADYFIADQLRRRFELATLPEENLSEQEMRALIMVRARRYGRALKIVQRSQSPAALMIKAIVAYERRRLNKALGYLDRAEAVPGMSDRRRAKAKVLRALVLHDSGDAKGVSHALRQALELDPTCQLARVGLETMGELVRGSAADAEKDLVAILATARRARAPLRAIGDQVLHVVWRVDQAFFRSVLGLKLLQMGHAKYAEEILERVVQHSPRCASARLHQGMVFAANCQATQDADERRELEWSARTSFILAAKLAPPESVTAQRAREQLVALDGLLARAADVPIAAE